MVALWFDLNCDITATDVTFQEPYRNWVRFVVQMLDSVDCISRLSLEEEKFFILIKSLFLRKSNEYGQ